jgi:hypothetical protein
MKTNITVGIIKPNTESAGNATNFAFGELVLKAKGINNCVPNTGTLLNIGAIVENGKLETGDVVMGWKDLNVFWEAAQYNGGDVLDKANYTPMASVDMDTNCVINADAIVSAWSDWSDCLNSLQTRTRTIITPAIGTGTTPPLSEEQACVMPSYIAWNFSDLTQSVANPGIACALNYPDFLYSEPFSFFDVEIFYTDTALTIPFVGDDGYYGVLKSGVQYSVQMNPSGYGSNKALCS